MRDRHVAMLLAMTTFFSLAMTDDCHGERYGHCERHRHCERSEAIPTAAAFGLAVTNK